MYLFGTVKGHKRAKGHFKDYEVGVSCIVLLVVQWLREGRVFMQFLRPKCLLCLGAIFRGGKNQDVLSKFAA